jgi:MFS transporter, ACS family, tartrate transporter
MLKMHDLSITQTGLASAVPYLAACIGMLVWARFVDRTRAFVVHYVASCLVAAAGFALAVATHSLAGLLAGVSIALVGINACRAPCFSILPVLAQGAAAAGTIAFLNSIGNLGGFLGPFMVGWLKDLTGSFAAAMWALAGMVGLAGLLGCVLHLVMRQYGDPATPE